MSKHETVTGLLARGLAAADVAAVVGCTPDYVRAVRNRNRLRAELGVSDYPAAAARQRERRRERYRDDPEYRAHRIAINRAWRRRRKAQGDIR